MLRVLVTGSAGAVGEPVCAELARRGHQVRGFDRVPTPGIDDAVVGDLTDREAVRAALQGVEAVIHLAAEPHDREFPLLVGPNVLGLFHVMDAARHQAVKRLVLASSMQVIGRRDSPGVARVDEASPGNHYALTKLWAEQMGEMYARRYGLSVVAARVAWMVRNVGEARRMMQIKRPELYLSRQDVGRFFASAVEAPDISFAIVYAASRDGGSYFDLEPAQRLLGYEPIDRWPEGLGFEPPAEEAVLA